MYKINEILEIVDHLLTLSLSSAKWHSINSSLLVNLISSVSLRCLIDSSSLFVSIFQNSSCFAVLSILNYLFLIEQVVKNGMGKVVEENYFIWKDTKLPVAGVTWSCYYNRRSPPDGVKIHKTQWLFQNFQSTRVKGTFQVILLSIKHLTIIFEGKHALQRINKCNIVWFLFSEMYL